MSSVEPFHLFRYNNHQDKNDADRLSLAMSRVRGKRLTYTEMSSKVERRRSR
jgi:hypothetical protein